MIVVPPAAPVIVPLLAAIVTLAVRRHPRLQATTSLAGLLTVGVIGALLLWQSLHDQSILVGRLGGREAPFGIVFVVDVLAALMVLVTALVAFVSLVAATVDDGHVQRHPYFQPLVQILVMGVNGAYLTGDLFNLYVWFEVLLIASFVLMALGDHQDQLEGALKYVVLNLFASILFLATAGIVYATTGTLNMAHLATALLQLPDGLRISIALLLFVAFGIKAALFPLSFWLPASYHTLQPSLVALFSGLLTKVGVVALVRLHTLLVPDLVTQTGPLVGIVAAATMLGGVLGAFSQNGIRRILSFHIISQIGFLLLAIAIGTPLALVGLVFYMTHNILAKADLFLVGGLVQTHCGSDALRQIGGVWRAAPALGLLFMVPALALAGVPPSSGFWAKLLVVQGTLQAGAIALAVAAILTGLLTLLSMLKIWNEAFWKDAPPAMQAAGRTHPLAWTGALGLALLIAGLGIMPGPLVGIAEAAATQLGNPDHYVDAVLGVQP